MHPLRPPSSNNRSPPSRPVSVRSSPQRPDDYPPLALQQRRYSYAHSVAGGSTIYDDNPCPDCALYDCSSIDNCEITCGARHKVPHEVAIRLVAACCIVFGVIEFGVGSAFFDFFKSGSVVPSFTIGFYNSYGFGAWWAAIITVIAGIFGLVARWRWTILTSCVMGALAVVPALIGATMDGYVFYYWVSTFKACASNPQSLPNQPAWPTVAHSSTQLSTTTIDQRNFACYGDYSACLTVQTQCLQSTGYSATIPSKYLSGGSSASIYPVYRWSADYTDDVWNNDGRRESNVCMCTDNKGCYPFYLSASSRSLGYNCGNTLTVYPKMLQSSMAFCILCAVASFALSILGCVSLMAQKNTILQEHYDDEREIGRSIHSMHSVVIK